MVEHSAAARAQKRLEEQQAEGIPLDYKPSLGNEEFRERKDAGFDERAKANVDSVAKVHEFRRKNISAYQAPDEDLFRYDAEESEMKYTALKAEAIFRHQNTFSAIRWGVTVGGLFALHRYYRARDFEQSLNWFCTVSGLSFIQIWAAHGLRDFVNTQVTTSGIQKQAREEYHLNAFKRYIKTLETSVEHMDDDVRPIVRNTQSESMDELIKDLEEVIKNSHDSHDLDQDQIFSEGFKRLFYQKVLSPQQYTFLQTNKEISNITKEHKHYQTTKNNHANTEIFLQWVDDVVDKISETDLKSYDFQRDPDCSYKLV